MADNMSVVWDKFFQHRTRTLWERFPGYYRALVVETNDPLNMYRLKFKCPEMHDFDVSDQDCPWAVPAFDLGGKRAGRFSHPCIGDWIWITFEKGHGYGPVWVGFAQPTRRKYYSYPSVFQITPLSVNEDGSTAERPQDYDKVYLPKDGRPMMHGWADRYGNLDMHSSVGFFPEEHKKPPPPPDTDAVQGSAFQQSQTAPEVNDPDKKYIARVTKYGNMLILSDQGYEWPNEFKGSFKTDEKYETDRWKALQKLLNEDDPKGDHRRTLLSNRYGSRIEMRDTGWAQQGPIASQSRDGEFGPPATLSKESTNDFRWIKLRTKGGMLWQAYDKGFNPSSDKFITRKMIDECEAKSEKEDEHWANKDARWIRTVTRHGFKFVLDDRGSDDSDADQQELPRGNGGLIKGRRTGSANGVPATGDPRGFYWEFNENDLANQSMWGSPLGQAMELNDRYQYMMMAVSLDKDWAAKWRGLEENEFIGKPMMGKDPETTAHHLKLDHANEYVRLKTRSAAGPDPLFPVNPPGVAAGDPNQGIEARDGGGGQGPWVEVVDSEHRGMWWSRIQKLGIWRASKDKKMYQWFDEKANKLIIYNNEADGTIEIFCAKDIKITSGTGDIILTAAKKVKIKSGEGSDNDSAGTFESSDGAGIHTNKDLFCKSVHGKLVGLSVSVSVPTHGTIQCQVTQTGEQPGGNPVDPNEPPELPAVIEPDDRAKTYNSPFIDCPRDEIEHPT